MVWVVSYKERASYGDGVRGFAQRRGGGAGACVHAFFDRVRERPEASTFKVVACFVLTCLPLQYTFPSGVALLSIRLLNICSTKINASFTAHVYCAVCMEP